MTLRKTCLTASLMAALLSSMTATASVAAPVMPIAPLTQEANAEDADKTNRLNINTASAQELSAVMIGVGLKRAEQIIKLREQLGGFTELEQLLDVKGIGLKTLEKNRGLIRLD